MSLAQDVSTLICLCVHGSWAHLQPHRRRTGLLHTKMNKYVKKNKIEFCCKKIHGSCHWWLRCLIAARTSSDLDFVSAWNSWKILEPAASKIAHWWWLPFCHVFPFVICFWLLWSFVQYHLKSLVLWCPVMIPCLSVSLLSFHVMFDFLSPFSLHVSSLSCTERREKINVLVLSPMRAFCLCPFTRCCFLFLLHQFLLLRSALSTWLPLSQVDSYPSLLGLVSFILFWSFLWTLAMFTTIRNYPRLFVPKVLGNLCWDL